MSQACVVTASYGCKHNFFLSTANVFFFPHEQYYHDIRFDTFQVISTVIVQRDSTAAEASLRKLPLQAPATLLQKMFQILVLDVAS